MQVLEHKNIKNTVKYTQLIHFKDGECVCKVAKTVKEAKDLIEVGFEYVCDIEGVKLFRKRKQFVAGLCQNDGIMLCMIFEPAFEPAIKVCC